MHNGARRNVSTRGTKDRRTIEPVDLALHRAVHSTDVRVQTAQLLEGTRALFALEAVDAVYRVDPLQRRGGGSH